MWRRDFTANALYYNIADFSIWDYVNGAEDIAARTLRLIGDPETRFREDPVRMLRAARFEAKLGFAIDPATAALIAPLRDLLGGVPPARLFDETLKLFLTGHGARSYEVLRRRGLLAALLPSVEAYFVSHPESLVEKLLLQGLKNTDARVLADKPVTPTFLFALLLYGPIAGIIEATPAAALARDGDHPRCLRSRDPRGADTHRHPQALLARRARDVRAAAAPRASAWPARAARAGTSALSCRLRPAAAACAVRPRAAGDGAVVDAPAGGVGRGARPHGRRARRCDARRTRAAAPQPQPAAAAPVLARSA